MALYAIGDLHLCLGAPKPLVASLTLQKIFCLM